MSTKSRAVDRHIGRAVAADDGAACPAVMLSRIQTNGRVAQQAVAGLCILHPVSLPAKLKHLHTMSKL